MSREKKFRAWNRIVKRMQYFKMEDLQELKDKIQWQNLDVMDFTGLLDKNKKEIYEGDIVEYKEYVVSKRWWNKLEDIPIIQQECEDQRNRVRKKQSEVKFKNGAFRLDYPITLDYVGNGQRFITERGRSCDIEEKQWDFEVIGNVFENPELLNREQNDKTSVATKSNG